jgi:hypothetical protein
VQLEYTFNGLDLKFPERRSFTNCAKEIEEKVKGLENLHFAVRKNPDSRGGYEIDLRAVSKDSDILSTVQTKNIYSGLKALKSVTVKRLRENKRKAMLKKRKHQSVHRVKEAMDDHQYKTAL